ncbi:MAG: hypothetical protein DRQ55_19000 [Planctomycetota bacterium]|nr:MAG: hypothetical protein DRQ55_19000 [Planctomycetota bacterium]
MGFLKRLFGGGSGDSVAPSGASGGQADDSEWREAAEATFDVNADRHRVSVWVRLYDPDFETTREQLRIFSLENRLMLALDEAGAGEHDTNSLERGYMGVRLVGEDADAIVEVILPLLSEAPQGSYLAVRRGPTGTGEDRIEVGLGSDAAEAADGADEA